MYPQIFGFKWSKMLAYVNASSAYYNSPKRRRDNPKYIHDVVDVNSLQHFKNTTLASFHAFLLAYTIPSLSYNKASLIPAFSLMALI
jgi:hypothetical protein